MEPKVNQRKKPKEINGSTTDRYCTVRSKFNQYNQKKKDLKIPLKEIYCEIKPIFMYFREDPSDRLAKPVFKKRDEGYEFQVGRP